MKKKEKNDLRNCYQLKRIQKNRNMQQAILGRKIGKNKEKYTYCFTNFFLNPKIVFKLV